jgi:large subunit ribosomal protein L3
LLISSTERDEQKLVTPTGGFKHFGLVKGDYVVVKGSIPGVPKRLIKMRQPIRDIHKKVVEPKVLEVVT